MACNACKCGVSLYSTGYDCTPAQEVAYKLIAVQTYDSTGTRNAIPFSATLNQAYFDALINQTDKSKRWYPLPSMKNISDVRGDNKTFEFDDQSMEFLAEGSRKFTGMIPGVSGAGANSPQMKQLIENVRCGDYSFYIVSVKNQLIGNLSADGLSLEPIEIDEQSIVAQFVKKTNDAPQHLLVSFNWSQISSDSALRMFDCDEVGGANLMGLRGLVGICYELVDSQTTSLTVKLKSSFGTPLSPILATGLVATDFVSYDDAATSKIWNETDQANVSITGVTESPAGTYELTFAAQDVSDVLILDAIKSGFDFTCCTENPIDVES